VEGQGGGAVFSRGEGAADGGARGGCGGDEGDLTGALRLVAAPEEQEGRDGGVEVVSGETRVIEGVVERDLEGRLAAGIHRYRRMVAVHQVFTAG
jgi:hypothetical protein